MRNTSVVVIFKIEKIRGCLKISFEASAFLEQK
jgi:hypothetical protein